MHRNDADIDSAANALAFAALALGLNIVVGFAGLLDLGYAAFFAIGAYAYGILQLVPAAAGMERASGSRSQWLGLVARIHDDGRRPGPFPGVVLADAAGLGGGRRVFRRAVRRADPAARGDYLAIVTLGFGEIVPIVARNMAERDQRRDGPERRRRAAAVRLQFRRRRRRPIIMSGSRWSRC